MIELRVCKAWLAKDGRVCCCSPRDAVLPHTQPAEILAAMGGKPPSVVFDCAGFEATVRV